MKTFQAVLCAICIACLYSCQPEASINPHQPGNDSIYIKKVIYLDTTVSVGLDTSQIYNFKYDNQKRIVSVYMEEFFVTAPGAELWDDYEFYYDGADTLPYKLVVRSGDYKTGFIHEPETVFISYSNGMVIRDSIVQAGRSGVAGTNLVYTYKKLGGIRYKTVISGTASYVFPDSVFSQVTRASSGNITYEKDSIYKAGSCTVGETRYLFDNQRNPYFRTALFYPVEFSSSFFLYQRFSNNQLGYKYTSQFYNEDETYEYQYRKDGYPISVRSKVNGQANGEKGIFIYTSL